MILFPEPQNTELFDQTYSFPMKDQYDDLTAFFHLVQAGLPGIRVATAPLLEKEEYRLTVDESGIILEASCDEGLFRAVTSLWPLLRHDGGKLRCMRVSDKPALPRRGYMLDISRGKKPRVDTIKGMIDFLAALKYNEFQLYMEGDCFKYAAYPKETADYDCLTPDDIRELDSYCRERFIDLVPNQNSFGHMYTWLKKPAFHHLGLFETEDEVPSTLNPLLP